MNLKTNKISNQVMWNRLVSVVEEQAQALIRTAFSTSVREAGDLSAGVYNFEGEMLAQAITGTPGHVNAMADSVGHFINHIGKKNFQKGDIYITNDPWKGTGHLHDITVVTPTFVNSDLIGFFACTAHIVDIGGRGFGADANSIYEEGLFIPIMHFFEKGKINRTLIEIIKANVREPNQLIGDLFALAACNEIGIQRLLNMMEEFKIHNLKSISNFILKHSFQATVEKINCQPKKQAIGTMTIDGYDTPVKLQIHLKIQQNEILCDFSGTSDIDRKGINVPLVYTKAYACYALKCAIAPNIPNNAGSLAPFKITAPINSIVNAVFPAPVALRHVIGHFIPDTIFNALNKILPDKVPTEGAGTLCNFQVSIKPKHHSSEGDNNDRYEVLTFNSGGSGARPNSDGLNATAFPSGVMTMPIEATENTGPIIIWRKELRPDSGGIGEFRGGLGQFMEVGVQDGYVFDFQAMFDRVLYPAKGQEGGGAGATTAIERNDGTKMKGKGKQFIPEGAKVHLAFPGGGGFGKVSNRRKSAIKKDLKLGYISKESAKINYNLTQTEINEILGHQKKK